MNESELQHLFETGVALHQSGRLADAEARYRQVLTASPDHAEALHLLGVLAGQAGRPDAAVNLIERSLLLVPRHTEARFNLANALASQGRFAEAISHYQQVLQQEPNFVEAMAALGNARRASGDRNGAVEIWERALGQSPNDALLLFHLATVKHETGDIPQAIALLTKASESPSPLPEVLNSLGAMLAEMGQTPEAIASLRKAISLRRDYPEALCNLGDALREAGQEQEASDVLADALRLRPDWPLALGNLANLQRQQGELDWSIETYQRAVSIAPHEATLWNNLGLALREKLDLSGAIQAHRRAIECKPDFAEARYALAWSLLLTGDFDAGWNEFEWRLRLKRRSTSAFLAPPWDGQPARDRTLLLYAEQGFGDTIQFLRYVRLIKERVKRIVLAVQPELVSLVKEMDLDVDVVALGDSLPPNETVFPLMSAARVFGMREMTAPYIRRSVMRRGGAIRVGVVWSGRSTYTNDRNRSIAVARLEPLKTAGAELHSLQTHSTPAWMIDHAAELTDLRAAADLIATLDLVISVDTAVAHLAGAMGKPTWVLLPYSPDWRWMLKREDSPWYPSARLFRQPAPGNWPSVIDRVMRELRHFTQLPRTASD